MGVAVPMIPTPLVGAAAELKFPEIVSGALENVCPPDHVFVPFSKGIVAPLVPVLSTAAVPKDVPLVFVTVNAPVDANVASPETLAEA